MNLKLTEIELIGAEGLSALERELIKDYVVPFQNKKTAFARALEKRIGLPEGAIGTSHDIDFGAGEIFDVAARQAQEKEEAVEESSA